MPLHSWTLDDSWEFLGSVECFDIANKRWALKTPLKRPRCLANLVVCEQRMYLIGGRTNEKFLWRGQKSHDISLTSVGMYNEAADTWEVVAAMKTGRHDAGCVVIGSKIYILGGTQSPTPKCLTSTECYDVDDNLWLKEPSLLCPAAGLSCCILGAL